MTAALPAGYLARETAISAAINGVLSALFFFAIFHGQPQVRVWGVGQYAFDFVPQSFMVALMGTLVPGLLGLKARRGLGLPVTGPLPIARRALGFAIAAVLLGAGAAAGLLWVSGTEAIDFTAGLAIKVAYGILLSLIVTPAMLRRVWA